MQENDHCVFYDYTILLTIYNTADKIQPSKNEVIIQKNISRKIVVKKIKILSLFGSINKKRG